MFIKELLEYNEMETNVTFLDVAMTELEPLVNQLDSNQFVVACVSGMCNQKLASEMLDKFDKWAIVSGNLSFNVLGGVPTTLFVSSKKRKWAKQIAFLLANDFVTVFTTDHTEEFDFLNLYKNIIPIYTGYYQDEYEDRFKEVWQEMGYFLTEMVEDVQLMEYGDVYPRDYKITTDENNACASMIGQKMREGKKLTRQEKMSDAYMSLHELYTLAKDEELDLPIIDFLYGHTKTC